MIVDSSALAAVSLGEPDAEDFLEALIYSDDLKMSAATFLETAIVLDRKNPGSLDRLTTSLGVTIVPVDRDQVEAAREAYLRYGRNSGHPARLNFGDCFTYALAKVCGDAVLCKGRDFAATDIPTFPV